MGAAQKVLVGSLEVVVVYEALLQLVGHGQLFGGEILSCEHVVAHLEVRAADGEHHGVGEQGAGGVDVLVGIFPVVACLVVVDVSGEDGLKVVLALPVVVLYNLEEVGEACLFLPQLVVAEIYCPGTIVEFGIADVVGAETFDAVHDKPLVFAVTLHRLEEQTVVVLKVYRIAAFLKDIASSAELVYLVTVEVIVGVHLIVAVLKIILPVRVARVHEVDITLPV